MSMRSVLGSARGAGATEKCEVACPGGLGLSIVPDPPQASQSVPCHLGYPLLRHSDYHGWEFQGKQRKYLQKEGVLLWN